MKILRYVYQELSKPTVLHVALPVLMVYVVIGTVVQKDMGLYAATKIFFADWLIWWGWVPFPGMPIILAVITLNLLFKLIFNSPWRLERSGTIITHISVLLLLIGGLLTALHAQEGYLDVARGEVKSYVADYHQRDLVLLDQRGQIVWNVDPYDISVGDKLTPLEGVTIEILELCRNCAVSMREEVNENHTGMARQMQIAPDELRHNDEENMTGATLLITSEGIEQIGLVLENVPREIQFKHNEQDYAFTMRRARRNLPFQVQLLDFQKELHPGTEMARAYSSRVKILDQGSEWESLITMNEPLRYKGYTLFQASYIEGIEGQGDVSVLAIVRNAGRSFPYLSGIMLCLGILVHLCVGRAKRREP